MLEMTRILLLIIATLTLSGCTSLELPKAQSALLDPQGSFTLYVSNQSFAISPVDVRVEIDGELVVSDFFPVGTGHSFRSFKLSLAKGKHEIRIWSVRGGAEQAKAFELKDHDVGDIAYWYYPRSHYNPTPRKFDFRTQKGPLRMMLDTSPPTRNRSGSAGYLMR